MLGFKRDDFKQLDDSPGELQAADELRQLQADLDKALGNLQSLDQATELLVQAGEALVAALADLEQQVVELAREAGVLGEGTSSGPLGS